MSDAGSGPTVEEMAAAVAGIDLWNTPGIPEHGLAALRVTDGPNGARGPSLDRKSVV